jgi:hypothetical protein
MMKSFIAANSLWAHMVSSFDHLPSEQMHARDLVELAAVVAAHGHLLIDGDHHCLSDANLKRYWSACKCRLDRWGSELKKAHQHGQTEKILPSEAHALVEEVFAAEALTRVWTAAATAYDERRDEDDVASVVSNVLNGHLEARHRALRLLADADPVNHRQSKRLTRLYRRIARWVDVLVAFLQTIHEVSRFAIEPERCRDFAGDLRRNRSRHANRHVWRLTFASLRHSLCDDLSEKSPNADLNYEICASIISCFDTNIFESTGAMRSVWLIRLLDNSEQCERMIQGLLAE